MRAPQTDEQRKEAQAFYRSPRWRQFRAEFLAGVYSPDRTPQVFCSQCEREGFTKLADELDHKVPRLDAPERAFDPTNIDPLCKRHHSQKTRREQLGLERAERVVVFGESRAATRRVEQLMREGYFGVPVNLALALPDHELRVLVGVLVRQLVRQPAARGVIFARDRRTAEKWAREIGATVEEGTVEEGTVEEGTVEEGTVEECAAEEGA